MDQAGIGGKDDRVIVLGLVGSTREQGRALLSELLDVDFDFMELKQHEDRAFHVKNWKLEEGIAEVYLDLIRSILYIHVPLDTIADAFLANRGDLDARLLLNKSSQRQTLALLATFLVSHFVLMLHSSTHLDLQLLGRLRSLQVLKKCMVPYIKRKFPLDPNSGLFKVNQELMRWRRVMWPGYCEPQMVFLYQDEYGKNTSSTSNLTTQLSELLDKCNILSKLQGGESWNLFNTLSRMRAMVLPKLLVGFNEEIQDWCNHLNPKLQVDFIEHEGMKALKVLVHKRRDHMRTMLKSGKENSCSSIVLQECYDAIDEGCCDDDYQIPWIPLVSLWRRKGWLCVDSGTYDVFPTVDNVVVVWKKCLTILKDSVGHVLSSPLPEHPPGKYPDIPEPPGCEATEKEMLASIRKALTWLIFSSNPMYQVSKILCEKAVGFGKEKYMKTVPGLYSQAVHESALQAAMAEYKCHARGPAFQEFKEQLRSECVSEWRSGRQQCEAKSLTGKPCTRGLRTVNEDGTVILVPCPHQSKPELKQASASGMTVRRRPDPFSFLDANITFYSECTSDELATCTALPPAKGPVHGRKAVKGKGVMKVKPTIPQPVSATCLISMDLPMLVRLWDTGQPLQEGELQAGGLDKAHMVTTDVNDRVLASVVIHGWSSLHRLGDAGTYNPAKGIQQEGFLPGRNLLHMVDLKISGNGTSAADGSADPLATQFPPLSGPTPAPSLEPLGAHLNAESLRNRMQREAVLNQWAVGKSSTSGPSAMQSETPRVMSDTPITSRRPKKGKRGSRGRESHFKEGRGRQQKEWDIVREGATSTPMDAHQLCFGLEYESLEGHRFIANMTDVSTAHPVGGGPLNLFGQTIPLFVELAVKEKKGQASEGIAQQSGLQCQLQRIYIITPHPPLLFALKPRILFHGQLDALAGANSGDSVSEPGKTVKFEFVAGNEIVLPPNSMCVVKLPFVYGAPSKWFGLSGFEGRLDCTSDAVENWIPVIRRENSPNLVSEVDGSSLLYPL